MRLHCTQDVLVKSVDDWKIALDAGKMVGTVLIDLSKAFDTINHTLLKQAKCLWCMWCRIGMVH